VIVGGSDAWLAPAVRSARACFKQSSALTRGEILSMADQTKLAESAVANAPEPLTSESPDSSLRRCFNQVREMIVHGRLAPGSRIVEADLTERLGVSRTPVRAALHLLQKEGYVVASAAGSRKARLAVAPLTKEDARELYAIVGHLEGLAARSTARLEPGRRVSVVAKLRELNDELRGLYERGRGDPNMIFELDQDFHQTLVQASAGPRLLALQSSIKPQAERYWRLYASAILDRLGLSVGEHVLIIQGIESGDSDAAERAVQLNWENGADRLSRVIDTMGERGSW
jgi:DNA-binding GntR family transcriptional regulator